MEIAMAKLRLKNSSLRPNTNMTMELRKIDQLWIPSKILEIDP
jgi:hypothetical protein